MSASEILDKHFNRIREVDDIGELDLLDQNDYTWGFEAPKWLGIFSKRDLVTFVGYPSCGKTEFTFFLAKENAAINNKVLYLSLELNPKDMLTRLARKKAGVSKLDRQRKSITNEQLSIMQYEYRKLSNIENLKIVSYDATPNIETIEDTMTKYKLQGYDLVFIDNLGKIDGDSNENIRFADISSRLQNFKNNNDTCIFLLHHLKKSGKQEQYTPGGPTAIRGSQKIMDNSSLVFELFRDLDPDLSAEERKNVELLLYKDTMDGATGSVTLKFNKGNYEIGKV